MKMQLIDFGGRSPEMAHANDAGVDVFSPKDVVIRPGDKENLFAEILLDFKR